MAAQQQYYQPSPYMQPQSAGNPASSYGSQGGAQAGPYGTPPPSYYPQNYNAQTSSGYRYTIPGYSPSGAPKQEQPPQGQWGFPTQQQGGYQYQPPPQGQQYQPQQPRPSNQPTSWQYPQAPQGPPPAGADPYMAWMSQIMQPYQIPGNPGGGIWQPQMPGGYAPQQGPQGGWNPFPGGQPPPQQANTDGYRPPQLTQAPLANAMPGWDNTKWHDPNHQTPKYVVGRILQGIPPRTDQMDIAVARIAAAYPGARRVGAGDISIPGVGTVDILQSAGAGGKAWQWGGGNSAQKFQGGAPAGYGGGAGGTDPFAQLMQLLMGNTPPAGFQAAQQPAVDPAAAKKAAEAAAAQKLADQRAATAAAEAKKAQQGQGGWNPSFAYY